MKVLWLSTDQPSVYNPESQYNGGGWIKSLLNEMHKYSDLLEIIYAFPTTRLLNIKTINNITYSPIKQTQDSTLIKMSRYWGFKKSVEYYTCRSEVTKIIERVQPDIIQVFGIEHGLASVVDYTSIPVIIHLQGIINPYINAYYPYGMNRASILLNGFFKREWIYRNGIIFREKSLKLSAKYERQRFSKTRYFMGRTDWDYNVSRLFSPGSKYFHVNECLREEFYKISYELKHDNPLVITSTISETLYKGLDLILKTAKLLKENTNLSYEWNIIGVNKNSPLVQIFEKLSGIDGERVGLKYRGVVNSEFLANQLLNSKLYVHPSYIDNSPNSICEAQILGIPVITTNVGGIKSLVEHKETGICVSANDPFDLAYWIKSLHTDVTLFNHISNKSKKVAESRHNKQQIVKEIMKIYQSILS